MDKTILLIIGIIAVVNIFVGVGGSYECESLGRQMGRSTKFSMINGCFIMTDKGWVPEKNWREVE